MASEVRIHPHATDRMEMRGATESEVVEAVRSGEQFPREARPHRISAQLAGIFVWRGRSFDTKQVEVYAAPKSNGWLAITVIVKFFSRSEAP